jgi:hypothetical protein
MSLINTNVTSTIANVYASSGNTVISVAYFCNVNPSTITFNLYAVPSGGSGTTTTQIYKDVQIATGDTFVVDMEKLVLGNGDMLKANASSNITATISYVGI